MELDARKYMAGKGIKPHSMAEKKKAPVKKDDDEDDGLTMEVEKKDKKPAIESLSA